MSNSGGPSPWGSGGGSGGNGQRPPGGGGPWGGGPGGPFGGRPGGPGPLPDLDARRELWPLHLPADVLADDVDTETLARLYPVPGGWIRNAAIAAAFCAAAAGDRIGQHHLVAAMRREYAKAALPFPGEPPRRRYDTV